MVEETASENAKKNRILMMRLSDSAIIFDGTQQGLNELPDSAFANQVRSILAPALAQSEDPMRQPPKTRNDRSSQPRVRGHKSYRLSWIHTINIAFIVFITLTSIVPALLSESLGIAIYASDVNAPIAKIFRHDIIISKIISASESKVNDILLLHNDYTWALEVRMVSSASLSGDTVTITANDGTDSNVSDQNTVQKDTEIHKIIRVIPGMGYLLSILTSIFAKVIGGLFLLAINILLQMRRARERRKL